MCSVKGREERVWVMIHGTHKRPPQDFPFEKQKKNNNSLH